MKSGRLWARRLGSIVAALSWCIALFGFVVVASPADAAEALPRSLRLATAARGGRYDAMGQALARLWQQWIPGTVVHVLPTGGGVHNLALLAEGDVDIALVSGEVAYEAYYGEEAGSDGPTPRFADLRLLAHLYPEVGHLVVTRWRPGSAEERPWKLAVGLPGSRDEYVAQATVGAADAQDDIRPHFQYLNGEQAFDYLRLGWIDGLFTMGPVPAPFAGELQDPGPFRIGLGSLTEGMLAAAAKRPWVFPFVIPAGTYPHQDEPVRTFAVPVVLAVSAAMDDDLAYSLARALHDGRHLLTDVLPIFRWVPPRLAFAGIPLPLHPGAERHLKEVENAQEGPPPS